MAFLAAPSNLTDQSLAVLPGSEHTFDAHDTITQSFLVTRQPISGIAVQIKPDTAGDKNINGTFTVKSSSGTIVVSRTDNIQNFLITSQSNQPALNEQSLTPGRWLLFRFEPVSLKTGTTSQFSLRTDAEGLLLPSEIDATKYTDGSISVNGRVKPNSLSFRTYYRASFLQRLQSLIFEQSRLYDIVLIVFLALVAIESLLIARQIKSHRLLSSPPILLFIILALFFSLPVYQNATNWGTWDWTEAASHYSAARHSLAAGQFPLWNPYFCGGSPSWGNPQTYWPSLTFLLTIVFGDIIGSKIAITTYLALGLIGSYLLSLQLKLSKASALIPAIIFMGNGFVSSHLAAGQLLWLSVAWVPWVFYYFLRSFRKRRYIIMSVIFLLLILLEGRVHLVTYISLFIILFSALVAIFLSPLRSTIIRNTCIFFILTLSLGAIKILPILDFLRYVSGALAKNNGTPWLHVPTVLLDRHIDLYYFLPWLEQPWHEYSSYIGWFPLILALAGLTAILQVRRRLLFFLFIISGLSFLLIVTAPASHSFIDFFPVLNQLRNSGRAMIMVVLALSLLAAMGTQTIINRFLPIAFRPAVTTIVAGIIFIDLSLTAAYPWQQIFSLPPITASPYGNTFTQEENRNDISYHTVNAGDGAANQCPAHLQLWQSNASITGHQNERYRGELFAQNGSGITLIQYTPNKITFKVNSITPDNGQDTIIVNQKYAAGWRASNRSVFAQNFRPAFYISAADIGQTITIKFLPNSFIWGSLISLVSAITILIVLSKVE
ncbi:MAG: hypothetical protein U1C49_02450 [Candidatus Andersenbacteria bacterium]|nr:hypothetical protein [Candidatus Andersenbacteria bacterium]